MAAEISEITKMMEGTLSRIRVDIERFQDSVEAYTDKDLPPLSHPDFMQECASRLDDISRQTYELGAIVSTLNRARRRLLDVVRKNGEYQLGPVVRRLDDEISSWLETYKSVSFNMVERTRALRSLLSAGSQER